jgi:hypothetical protein
MFLIELMKYIEKQKLSVTHASFILKSMGWQRQGFSSAFANHSALITPHYMLILVQGNTKMSQSIAGWAQSDLNEIEEYKTKEIIRRKNLLKEPN